MMFDKFEARRQLARAHGSDHSVYAWWYWANNHHARYKRFVESMKRKLVCQDCGGEGQHWEDAVDYYNIYVPCGWCEGTGYVTPWIRGAWLAMKRAERN